MGETMGDEQVEKHDCIWGVGKQKEKKGHGSARAYKKRKGKRAGM